MDIATKFASGQEAVEAIFRKDKQPQGRQQEDVPEASAQRDTKKKAKKKAQAKRCSIPKIQILKFSQTRSKFKMNFKFHFKMFVCELISTNKI
jgi:hypothetical protein